MNLVRCLHITQAGQALRHMEKVGVDPGDLERMEAKCTHFSLKVENIPPRTANLLKQELLSLGGDAAVDGRGLDCSTPTTDTILMGTRKQIEKLILKLDQHPDLHPLGRDLKQTLENASKTLFSIRCRKRTYTLGRKPLLMGVLNVTPDSFSDGGVYFEKEKAVTHALRMVEEGADLIDIGGESTRPGSKLLTADEELGRVMPVIEALVNRVNVPISIDTYKAAVAKSAIEAGAEIINDISGLHFDPSLAEVAARADTPLILMHIRGTPETMQKNVHYDSLFSEILLSLRQSAESAELAGVDPNQIIVDPGIGFGKSLQGNLLILQNLSEFRVLGKPILLGTSRKTFIGKILNAQPHERLEGTLASIAIGVLNGAHIIRSHDVAEARRAIAVANAIRFADEVEGDQG